MRVDNKVTRGKGTDKRLTRGSCNRVLGLGGRMVNMGDDVRVCLLEVKVGPFLYTQAQTMLRGRVHPT